MRHNCFNHRQRRKTWNMEIRGAGCGAPRTNHHQKRSVVKMSGVCSLNYASGFTREAMDHGSSILPSLSSPWGEDCCRWLCSGNVFCFVIALVLLQIWYWCDIALTSLLWQNYFLWYRSGMAQALFWHCSGIALALLWHWSGIVLALIWYC